MSLTPGQRKARNTLERKYLADLHRRTLRAPCSRCRAKPGKTCVFLDGPRRGQPMAGTHGDRNDEANRRGYVKGPRYWRSRARAAVSTAAGRGER